MKIPKLDEKEIEMLNGWEKKLYFLILREVERAEGQSSNSKGGSHDPS